jgi:hypothetical protein
MANTETINAATMACTCTNAILPTIMCDISLNEDKFPKFAWVDSLSIIENIFWLKTKKNFNINSDTHRDARHISKFPFNPKRAGTRINNSEICLKTFQCCNKKERLAFLFLE